MYDLKKLKSLFDKISYTSSEMTSFVDILDFTLLPFRFYENGDLLNKAHQHLLSFPKKELIAEFMTELAELNPDGFADPLGEFYMTHISYGRLGQYFTPEPITDMTAMMIIGDDLKPGQKVLDPACGSGRFILSAAKINRSLDFYGADLDSVCCKMALVNMLLNSLTGEVAHMNSISNEFFIGYKVKLALKNGFYYPFFEEFTTPEYSNIWLHPQLPKAQSNQPVFIQGSLF